MLEDTTFLQSKDMFPDCSTIALTSLKEEMDQYVSIYPSSPLQIPALLFSTICRTMFVSYDIRQLVILLKFTKDQGQIMTCLPKLYFSRKMSQEVDRSKTKNRLYQSIIIDAASSYLQKIDYPCVINDESQESEVNLLGLFEGNNDEKKYRYSLYDGFSPEANSLLSNKFTELQFLAKFCLTESFTVAIMRWIETEYQKNMSCINGSTPRDFEWDTGILVVLNKVHTVVSDGLFALIKHVIKTDYETHLKKLYSARIVHVSHHFLLQLVPLLIIEFIEGLDGIVDDDGSQFFGKNNSTSLNLNWKNSPDRALNAYKCLSLLTSSFNLPSIGSAGYHNAEAVLTGILSDTSFIDLQQKVCFHPEKIDTSEWMSNCINNATIDTSSGEKFGGLLSRITRIAVGTCCESDTKGAITIKSNFYPRILNTVVKISSPIKQPLKKRRKIDPKHDRKENVLPNSNKVTHDHKRREVKRKRTKEDAGEESNVRSNGSPNTSSSSGSDEESDDNSKDSKEDNSDSDEGNSSVDTDSGSEIDREDNESSSSDSSGTGTSSQSAKEPDNNRHPTIKDSLQNTGRGETNDNDEEMSSNYERPGLGSLSFDNEDSDEEFKTNGSSEIESDDLISTIDYQPTFGEEDNFMKEVYSMVEVNPSYLLGCGERSKELYGELTYESMQEVLVQMVEHSELNNQSRMIDVGSGFGKPSMHAANYPGVLYSQGIDFNDHYVKSACKVLEMLKDIDSKSCGIAVERKCKMLASKCFFAKVDVTDCESLNPFTHVYMHDTV